MDVTTSGLRELPEVGKTAGPAAVKTTVPAPSESKTEKKAPTPAAEALFEPRSSLKFSLRAADVNAKFEIHKATSRVIMTMYDRETGEVLREFPSRHVLDVLGSIAPSGQKVDTTS